jgi:hypothetical protein
MTLKNDWQNGDLFTPAAANDMADAVNNAATIVTIDPTASPYGVKMDRYTTTEASMSSSVSPTHLTVTGYTFTSADIGKVVKVVGAAAAGANLKTTISSISSGKAVLASPCLTTVSGAFAMFGTDNATALEALFTDLRHTGRDRKLSRTALFPAGVAMYSGTLTFPTLGTIKGVAENWVSYDIMYARFGGAENTGGTVFYQIWDQNADCARVRTVAVGQNDWNGNLEGFSIIQDWENTAGNGLSFRNSSGDAVKVIDGGTINRVAVMGCAGAGFDFAGGSIAATFRDLQAFCCGYVTRKTFTGNTTSGSNVITNVSSTSGLAYADIMSVPGMPPDSVVQAVDAGAGTVTVTTAATATATGVTIQRMGSPGIRYQIAVNGSEVVHFDFPSGDQNSGGVLRIDGPGRSTGTAVIVTNLKNEFAANVYWEGYPSVTGVPQGSNAIVLNNVADTAVVVRGLTHWANATSSVGGTEANPFGRDIGAAILSLNTATAATVNWDGLSVRLATGSGQTIGYAYRDAWSSNNQPLPSNTSGRGTNRPEPKVVRSVSNANATVSYHDSVVEWSSISAARTATLPLLSTVPAGREYLLIDTSGSASTTNTITATPSGSDTIVGSTQIANAYGQLSLISNGSSWVGASDVTRTGTATMTNKTLVAPRIDTVAATNGTAALAVNGVSSAANYLGVSNAATGGAPALYADGSDTNVGILLIPQGTGAVQISADTGVTPRVQVFGTDTDVSLNLQTKNAGKVQINAVEAVDISTSQALTNKNLSSGTNTFPTLNQNTTGTASNVTGTVAVGNGGTGATTLTGLVKGTGTTAMVAATAGTDYLVPDGAFGTPSSVTLTNATGLPTSGILDPDDLTTGESTFSRRNVSSNSVASSTGVIRLTYFTAKKTETITQVRTISGVTAATSATLCRVGVYSVDGSGNLTVVALSPAAESTLWAAANTAYTRTFTASFTKTKGQRYAVGLLYVGTGTAPTMIGQLALTAGTEVGVAPRLGGFVSGQTDLGALSSTIAVGSVVDSSHWAYTVLLP